MKSQALINFKLSTGRYSCFISRIMEMAAIKEAAVICVANVHMFAEAQQGPAFLQIINNADIVTPDGKPMAWAFRLLYGIKQDRVAGMDLLPDLLAQMEKEQMSPYFYGGSQEMLDKTKSFLEQRFPQIPLAGFYSPPFRVLNEDEERHIAARINNARPNIVFVILGCPKQEKWMHRMKDKLNCVMIGVGGALPVMIGQQKRAPAWMQNAGLEWFYRLVQEPGRLFKRYAITNSIFIWLMIKEWIRLKWLVPLKLSKSDSYKNFQ